MNDDEVDDDLIIQLCGDGAVPSVDIPSATPQTIQNDSMKETGDGSSKPDIKSPQNEDNDIFDVYMRPPNYECKTRVRQITIKEAWERKRSVTALKKTTTKKKEGYNFVYSRLECRECSPHSRLMSVGDEKYLEACTSTNKWYDTDFISTFCSLVAHDAHTLPCNYPTTKKLEMIHIPYPDGIVREHNVKSLNADKTHLICIAHSNDHYAVLEFDLANSCVHVYDGLNYKLNNWQNHVIYAVKEHGLVPIGSKPKVTYDSVSEGKSKAQTLTIKFGDESLCWVVKNSCCTRQKDGYNCGPLACLNVMFIYGCIGSDAIPKMAEKKGGIRGVVVSFFNELLERYNDIMPVDITFEDDVNDQEQNRQSCFCQGKSGNKVTIILDCCQNSVHQVS